MSSSYCWSLSHEKKVAPLQTYVLGCQSKTGGRGWTLPNQLAKLARRGTDGWREKTHCQTATVIVEWRSPEWATLASSEPKSPCLWHCCASVCSDTATTKTATSCVSRLFAGWCYICPRQWWKTWLRYWLPWLRYPSSLWYWDRGKDWFR